MNPILLGLAGAVFLLTVETGGRIQSFERTTQSKVLDVYNGASGQTDGSIFHDFWADYTVEIITTTAIGNTATTVGTGGTSTTATATTLVNAGPGITITLGNITSGNGVIAGGVYCLTTRLAHRGEDLQRFTVTARQRPGIT